MAVTYQSQASAAPTSGITITVNKPSGTVEGDVLVAMISVKAGVDLTINPPAGWTAVGQANTAIVSIRTGVWYKVAGASEGGSYAWTSTQTISDATGLILRYAPQSPTTPPGVIDASAMGSAVSPAVAPSLTATENADTLIALFSTNGTPGSTPSGMTQRAAINGANSGAWAYDQQLDAPGAAGTRTWTGSTTGVGWSILLKAAQAGSRIRMMI